MNKRKDAQRGAQDSLRAVLLSIAKCDPSKIDAAQSALRSAIIDYKTNAYSQRGLAQQFLRTPKARTRASLDALHATLATTLAAIEKLDGEAQALFVEHCSNSGLRLANLAGALKTANIAARDALLQSVTSERPDPDYYQEMLALDVAMVLRYVLNVAPMTARGAGAARESNRNAAKYAMVLEKVLELAEAADEIDLEKLTAAGLRRLDESGRTHASK